MSRKEEHYREMQRWRWAREHGASAAQANELRAIVRFRNWVEFLGLNPDEIGDFAKRHHGGGRYEKKLATPYARMRSGWYHALRELGASSIEAARGSTSEFSFRLAKKKFEERIRMNIEKANK